MKTFFRELICMIVIAAVMVLILVLFFYDYLVNDNTIPTESKYTRSSDVSQALKDKKEYDEKAEEAVIGTLTKAAYNIDENDIDAYIAEGLLTQGKPNPFQEMKENNTQNNDSNESGSSNSNGSSNNGGSSNSNSENQNSNTNTTDNSGSSTGTFFEKPGTK